MKIRSIFLSLFTIILFANAFFGQSPNTLRQKCPNTSIYSTVQITGVGDINVQPCAGKTTTFTQSVVLPAGTVINGGNVILANGSVGTPSLRYLNSTTTGLYRPADKTVGISTNGVENSTFATTLNSQRSDGYTFQNSAATAEFALGFVPSSTVGTFTLGDCATTPTTCFKLTQSTDTISYGTGTATISDETAINKYSIQKTNTAAGTTGNQTISKPGGTVNIAAGAASIVVTNTTVTTASLPFVTLRTADATCTFVKSAVPTANTLTITLNANCTAEQSVAWFVLN